MIKKIEPRAQYTNCYGHALNLACADTIEQCKIVTNALETTHEISKLVKCSPKREAWLETIRKNTSDEAFSNIRRVCPTRWTVRADSMQSIINNYEELTQLWEWSLEEYTDTETKYFVNGCEDRMSLFGSFH